MSRSVVRSPSKRRTVRMVAFGVLGLGVLATGTTLFVLALAINAQARNDERAPADAIVVLGAAQYNGRPTRAFRARLDHAATLYRQGYASTIVLVGGTAAPDDLSEAEVGARYLQQLGIPPDALIVVPEGRNTWRSLQAAADDLRARGVRRLLLVSDGFHLFRSKLMARDLGFDALGSPAPNSPIRPGSSLERWYIAREVFATLAYLLGRR
ncbi:MAG: YdcF family protein [Thermomicrobium sp.]|nr:YdcF family protein [Thermomicrobium sp.]MDW8007679.1 YdcF family protein [Thermomicrobium sp.]